MSDIPGRTGMCWSLTGLDNAQVGITVLLSSSSLLDFNDKYPIKYRKVEQPTLGSKRSDWYSNSDFGSRDASCHFRITANEKKGFKQYDVARFLSQSMNWEISQCLGVQSLGPSAL